MVLRCRNNTLLVKACCLLQCNGVKLQSALRTFIICSEVEYLHTYSIVQQFQTHNLYLETWVMRLSRRMTIKIHSLFPLRQLGLEFSAINW